MQFNTHYYVLALGTDSASLYEAFRDSLIGIEDKGFPVIGTAGESNGSNLMRNVEAKLRLHQSGEPLGLVVVGDEDRQAAFDSITSHSDEVVVRVFRDRSDARPSELGQIAWSLVKEEISGVLVQARLDLADSVLRGATVSGLGAVVAALGDGGSGDLLVEDDYRVRGSVVRRPGPAKLSPEVDIRDAIDDAVDSVIEDVLRHGGRVTFMRAGTLEDHDRIVLMLRERLLP